MDKFIMTVVVILLVYLCVYAVVNRICKCIEHHTEWKYRARIDLEWTKAQRMCKSERSSEKKERCQDV